MAAKAGRRTKSKTKRSNVARGKRTVRPAAKRVAKAKKAKPAMSEEAMMAAWQKAMTPGEPHRRLEPLVGTWDAKVQVWMSPEAPPSVGEGISEHRWVLGSRYVEQVYRGTAMGMPFEGIGYTGYDNVQRKYVGTWMDGMSTGIMTSVGGGQPSKLSFKAKLHDAVSGKETTFDSIVRIKDRDHHTYEMWAPTPGGKRFRTMLAEYTRKV